MVLLNVHPHGLALVPLERDAPGPVDMQAVTLRLSAQRVKVKARHVGVFEPGSVAKGVQSPPHPRDEVGGDLCGRALVEQLRQPLVPEAANHSEGFYGAAYAV